MRVENLRKQILAETDPDKRDDLLEVFFDISDAPTYNKLMQDLSDRMWNEVKESLEKADPEVREDIRNIFKDLSKKNS
ncbi:MAG: hypothetical protein GY827_04485 [Cytophagales bacterium]|nr:hypothetical protein [Cytophagales bacterium]